MKFNTTASAIAESRIDAPDGIHFIGGGVGLGNGDFQHLVTVFNDTLGRPDRMVVVGVTTISVISIIEYRRVGNTWIHNNATEALDNNVTLTYTASAQNSVTAFAIDNPAGTGDCVLFIAGNNDVVTDTFEMDSIVLTPGALTATSVVIAGANQPTDTDLITSVSTALSTTKVMTIFEDDGHFADITESGGTYTFTYDDAKEVAIDTSIAIDETYSIQIIGSQVVLIKTGVDTQSSDLWELTTAGVLVEEFRQFTVGGLGNFTSITVRIFDKISAINGRFAIAVGALGSGIIGGDEGGYIMTTYPQDEI